MKAMWKEVALAILRRGLKVQGWLWLDRSQETVPGVDSKGDLSKEIKPSGQ